MEFAAVRPDDWDLALLVHLLGSFVLVGAVTLAVTSLAAAWTNGSAAMTRLAYRSLLWVALPAWLVMRLGAQWIADEQGLLDLDEPPAWVEIGFIASEPFLLPLLIGTVLAGIGARRTRDQTGDATKLDRWALVLVSLALISYLVAIWAMTTKPV